MYHEIRESRMLHPGQSLPIVVRQSYEDNLPSPLFVSLENFSAQMEYLYANNYHTLTLEEIQAYYYKGAELPRRSVLITFDDCYQSIRLYAYPILKQYKFHAAAFVVTGWLNTFEKPFDPEKSICLTEHELEEMSDVFEFANHTELFHTRLDQTTSKLMEAGDAEFAQDLDHCSEHPLIRAKEVFAYPFGLFTDRNLKLLRKKGFRLAFTSDNGRNDITTDPLLLKRNAIPYFMEFPAFQALVQEV
jgi:peptidoglycan/xylan/chitin deacetylase (PgdA/CDA1 family)